MKYYRAPKGAFCFLNNSKPAFSCVWHDRMEVLNLYNTNIKVIIIVEIA